MDGQYLRNNNHVTLETAMNCFNINFSGRPSGFLFVSEWLSVSRVIQCLKIGTYLSNKGLTNLT